MFGKHSLRRVLNGLTVNKKQQEFDVPENEINMARKRFLVIKVTQF